MTAATAHSESDRLEMTSAAQLVLAFAILVIFIASFAAAGFVLGTAYNHFAGPTSSAWETIGTGILTAVFSGVAFALTKDRNGLNALVVGLILSGPILVRWLAGLAEALGYGATSQTLHTMVDHRFLLILVPAAIYVLATVLTWRSPINPR